MNVETLSARIGGTVITRFDPVYDSASDALVWNGRKPERQASLIVRASSAADVQEAVRYAAAAGMTVSPRGGGHQFTGIAARADMVIDLGALDGMSLDVAGCRARIEPAVTNTRLAAALDRHGLAFPTGHCGSVTVSGYLLGGGIGWNAAAWGIACFSVLAVEVVMADGSLITASATEHPDVFWAVRGGGPEFFGIVTAYHVRLYEAPRGATTVVRVYPAGRQTAVALWAERVMAKAPECVEFTLKVDATPQGPVIAVIASVFAAGEAEAQAICAALGQGAPDGALEVAGPMPTPIPALYGFTDPSTPKGHRYGVDTFWSDARLADALAPMVEAVARAPSRQSFAVMTLRPNARPVPSEAAFSCSGRIIGVLYGVWPDEEDDAANLAWLRAGLDACRPVALGSYVGEADLDRPGGPLPTLSPAAAARLAELGLRHDPAGLFGNRATQRLAAE
ncbi:FAD-binding oxidoreductase [Salipiger thiooxidans]|uniref:FAD-binding oxidoreductase n=1 Tax=Salipiger thiooxidans TaxID=282683 RepID=UPI001CD56288|nr:FAD-binding oxidoreductase [Salipiger thiooxidans]MCA0845966.1 FAD-binding oxidoreductase [Salipiger thiooxidans]